MAAHEWKKFFSKYGDIKNVQIESPRSVVSRNGADSPPAIPAREGPIRSGHPLHPPISYSLRAPTLTDGDVDRPQPRSWVPHGCRSAVVDFFDVRHARLAFAEAHGTRFHNSRLNVQLDMPTPADGSARYVVSPVPAAATKSHRHQNEHGP